MGRRDAGSAVPIVVGLVAVAVALAVAIATLAGAAVREARAQAVADVVALQAAQAQRQSGQGCARAARVTSANGAAVVSCHAAGVGDVTVAIQVGSGLFAARASARAGPAFADRQSDAW
ncbi:helicase [Demequina capsici]|uniref:Helicase n=1 Tax=Demequina capsici TaxID=3075620 RepID=A0AA96J896_9MICO|nr:MULTISPECIES: Rv3654c family TadE-like protein [unclassified Demequina]WNM24838.1 helicase [Demequina sp. OYTSA14]WNM27745.1 helicase [Demequina sp. PMTSA13]